MGKYVFPLKNHFASILCETSSIIYIALEKEGRHPKYAYPLLLYLIAEIQKINVRKSDDESIKPFECSESGFAEKLRTHDKSIQRAIKWLKENDWMSTERIKGKQKTLFLPNVKKICIAIDEYFEVPQKVKKKKSDQDTGKPSEQLIEDVTDWGKIWKNHRR